MHLAAYQVILITVYAFIAINDSLISNTLTQPAIAGMISGMIMGDLKTGLMVGGTLQLMRLGIAAFGGPRLFYRRSTGDSVCRDLRKRRGIRHRLSSSSVLTDAATGRRGSFL